MISNLQVRQFERDGYLIIPDYARNDEIFTLKSHIQEIVRNAEHNPKAIFSTKEAEEETDLAYFLESGDKISCFFEESKNHKNKRVVNKVGHNLHELDPIFEKFSNQEKLLKLALMIGLDLPCIIQSQYIFKSPGVGGEVTPHTDSTFLYTEPQSCLGVWIALDDATEANGCLWGLPGSHRNYPLYQRYVRNEAGTATTFIPLEEKKPNWDLKQQIPLPVKRGTAILLHGRFVHSSQLNSSPTPRNAYVMHLIDRKAHYPSNNWLQRAEIPKVF